MRHLTPSFAVGALRRGKEIEQLLGPVVVNDRAGLRYLTLSGRGPWTLSIHDVEDIGTATFSDMSEFPPLDPAEGVGEGRNRGRYSSPEEALAASAEFGASADRWVNQGVVGDEYLDARRSDSA